MEFCEGHRVLDQLNLKLNKALHQHLCKKYRGANSVMLAVASITEEIQLDIMNYVRKALRSSTGLTDPPHTSCSSDEENISRFEDTDSTDAECDPEHS